MRSCEVAGTKNRIIVYFTMEVETLPWTYEQSSGRLYSPAGAIVTLSGVSGNFLNANSSSAGGLPFGGPIPPGPYNIGQAYHHPHLGPSTMDLTPIGHNALGRKDFRIHGTSGKRWASAGCLILDPQIRLQIALSGDRVLQVR